MQVEANLTIRLASDSIGLTPKSERDKVRYATESWETSSVNIIQYWFRGWFPNLTRESKKLLALTLWLICKTFQQKVKFDQKTQITKTFFERATLSLTEAAFHQV